MAMGLNPWIYAAVQLSPAGIVVALTVVGLASISEALGQSVVLFINRVRPRRFVLALGISIFSQMVGFLLWVSCVWLISTFVFDAPQSFVAIAAAVGLAYAPQILAFFELTPFLGNAFAVILSLWSMAAIVIAIEVGAGLALWQAIVTSGLGWMLIQIWRRSLGRPIYALGNWMQRRVTGNALIFTLADVPKLRHPSELIDNWERWREALSRSRLAELSQQTIAEISQRFDRGSKRGQESDSDASRSIRSTRERL